MNIPTAADDIEATCGGVETKSLAEAAVDFAKPEIVMPSVPSVPQMPQMVAAAPAPATGGSRKRRRHKKYRTLKSES